MLSALALVLIALAAWARGRWRAYVVSRTVTSGDIDAAGRARQSEDRIPGVVCIAGASVSGLLAARICSNHFERVILYDTEECFPDARPRSRVRQHDQLHLFLALLWPALQSLFPTFKAELVASSGSVVAPASVSYKAGGFAMLPDSDAWTTRQIYTSREALEGLLRKLVLALPNVEARVGTVTGFEASSDRRRVTSVQIRAADGATEDIAVAALIDASGTTNGSIGWLRKAGYPAPVKRTYDPRVRYTSFTFHTTPQTRAKFDAISPRPWAETGHIASAFVGHHATSWMRIDGDRVRTLHQTIVGTDDDDVPRDLEHYRAMTALEPYREWSHRAIQILLDAPAEDGADEPKISHLTIGACYKVDFDPLHMPSNLFVCGDSATRVNPIAGQGCTKAAVDALTLDHVLRRSPPRAIAADAAARFVELHDSRVASMWDSTRAHDYSFDTTTPLATERLDHPGLKRLRRINAFLGRAARSDAQIGATLVDVAGQIRPFGSLLSPSILLRAAFVHATGRAIGASASSGQTIETLIPRSRRTGSRVLSPPSSPVRERVVKIASEYEANAHAHSSAAPVGLLDSGRRSFWAYFAVPVGLVVALGVLAGGWSYSHGDHLDLGWDASMARPVQPTSMINSSMPLFDSDGNVVLSARAVKKAKKASAKKGKSKASRASVDCGSDPWSSKGSKDGSGTGLNIRPNHPRLIAPAFKWACLPKLIQSDPYLSKWHTKIVADANRAYNAALVTYVYDGGPSGSGVLDPARQVQMRIKLFAYMWRMTQDTKWVSRAWNELYAMSGDKPGASATKVGKKGDTWNSKHFLDVGEFTFAFALAYDQMFDGLSTSQKASIRGWIVNLGLTKAITGFSQKLFWTKATGNWNCVTMNGFTAGALAIYDEDTSGTAKKMLSLSIPSALNGCAMAISSDGTWLETQDYFYFGITGHATLTMNLLTATGSDQGMLSKNAALKTNGLFHIHGTGNVEKFNWGDCGPNKYTATANALMLYGDKLGQDVYAQYQREADDAPEPFAMFQYNPDTPSGPFWQGLPLDRNFGNKVDAWAAMRSSWTDSNSLWVAIKAGSPLNKQTHSNLDAGDFKIEALGQIWAGELCQQDYLSKSYFSSDGQDAIRWQYYRDGTEGQNTLVLNTKKPAQIVSALPTTSFGTTGDTQTSSSFTPSSKSAAYWKTDLSKVYGTGAAKSVQRGIRLLDARRAVLIRDEIVGAKAAPQWRMHTNATIALSSNKRTATLKLGGETLIATLRSPAASTFTTLAPKAYSTDVKPPSADLPNPGVTVLAVNSNTGASTIEILFEPQWSSGYSAGNVPSVALSSWSTSSHL